MRFQRRRGLVWVCDVSGSSQMLNRPESADRAETFLQRLYWVSVGAVECAGGRFLKWTGDGFLAWFDVELHRSLPGQVGYAIDAAYYLSMVTILSQFGVPTPKQLRLRHAMTFEHDAALLTMSHDDGHQAVDLLGRSVVLAFRLSSVPAPFPSIAVTGDLLPYQGDTLVRFSGRRFSRDERLRYFKGESFGTSRIFLSADTSRSRKPRMSVSTLARRTAKHERALNDPGVYGEVFKRFGTFMKEGPEWSRAAFAECEKWHRESVALLKETTTMLQKDREKKS